MVLWASKSRITNQHPHRNNHLQIRPRLAPSPAPEIEIRIGDARETVLGGTDQFDAVLLDAPCSGLGTTRRKPEVKWKAIENSTEALSALQKELLDGAAAVVKKGGVLVYSVCSPMPTEGREMIAQFLDQNSTFSVVDPQDILPRLPSNALDRDLNIRLRTHLHSTDAFFMTRLVRH